MGADAGSLKGTIEAVDWRWGTPLAGLGTKGIQPTRVPSTRRCNPAEANRKRRPGASEGLGLYPW